MATKQQLLNLLDKAEALHAQATTDAERQEAEDILMQIQQRVVQLRQAQPQTNVGVDQVIPRAPVPQTPQDTAFPGELIGPNPEVAARVQAQAMANPAMTRGTPMEQVPIASIGVPRQLMPEPGMAERLITNFGQGATLGLGDEFQQAVLGDPQAAQRVRGVLAASEESNPVESFATQAAGSIVNPLSILGGNLVAGATTIPRALAMTAGLGAAEGGIEAVGRGDGEATAADIGLGAAVGGAAPTALGGLSSMISGLWRGFTPDAARGLGNLIEETDVTPSQLSAALTETPETIPEVAARLRNTQTVTDTPLGAMARSLNTRPGAPRQTMGENFQARADKTQERVEQLVGETFGGERKLINREAAGRAYNEFRAQPFPEDGIPPNLQAMIDEYPEIKKAMRSAGRSYHVRNPGATPDEIRNNWSTMDNVKRSLDARINRALRKGDNQTAADIGILKDRWLGELDRANPAYAQARAIYADGAAAENAQLLGQQYMKGPRIKTQVQDQYNRMSPAEKEQFRIGALDEMITTVRSLAGDSPDMGRKLVGSPELQNRLREIAPDPAAVDEVINRLRIESDNVKAARQITAGSPTAARTAEMDMGGVLRTLGRVLVGTQTRQDAANAAVDYASRWRWGGDRANQALAEMLSQSNPAAVRGILAGVESLPTPISAQEQLGGALIALPTPGILGLQDEER